MHTISSNILKDLPKIPKILPIYTEMSPMILKHFLSLSKASANFRNKMLRCTSIATRLATLLPTRGSLLRQLVFYGNKHCILAKLTQISQKTFYAMSDVCKKHNYKELASLRYALGKPLR